MDNLTDDAPATTISHLVIRDAKTKEVLLRKRDVPPPPKPEASTDETTI